MALLAAWGKRQTRQQARREQPSFNYWRILTFQICAQILLGPLGRIKCSLSAGKSTFSPDRPLEAYLKHLPTGAGLIISLLSV